MTTTIRKLRRLISEALFRATAPERFRAPAIDVEADSTLEAGRVATKKWFEENGIRGIDDMSVSLEPMTGGEKGDRSLFLQDVLRDVVVALVRSRPPPSVKQTGKIFRSWLKTIASDSEIIRDVVHLNSDIIFDVVSKAIPVTNPIRDTIFDAVLSTLDDMKLK